ncbi:MAG: protein kinase [Lentisphaeria bacterium]|nr:protein kinase [Lentisphaeria bacterium]
MIGRVDRYALLAKLGEGGFGAVYRARDEVAEIEVALKLLPALVVHHPEEFGRIKENFRLVAKLRHPNIANVMHLHDVSAVDAIVTEVMGVRAGDRLIVMDYVRGVTLSGWRQQHAEGCVSLPVALPILEQLAAALDYAHSQRIIHRDIKPANVIVGADGQVRILDFGLAAEIRSSLSRVSFSPDDRAGTPAYMAPEQWTGKGQDGRADQYGLAVLAYELLSGKVPFASAFEAANQLAMYCAVRSEVPEEIPELGAARNAVLRRGLAKDPAERFPCCADFVQALGRPDVHESASAVVVPEGAQRDRREAPKVRGQASSMSRVLLALALLLAVILLGIPAAYLRLQALLEAREEPVAEGTAREVRREEVMAQIREARNAASKGQSTAALALVRRALDLDPGNGEALALRAEILLHLGLDVIVPLRSEAQLRLRRLRELDRGQGIGERVDTTASLFEAANLLCEAKDYELALAKYEQFLQEYDRLEALESLRQAALRESSSALEARDGAAEAAEDGVGGEVFAGAEQLAGSARKAFDQGDFEGAAKMWVAACAQFAKAGYFAMGIRAVQEARDAYDAALGAVDRDVLAVHGGEMWTFVSRAVMEAERLGTEGKWYEAAASWGRATEALPGAYAEACAARDRAATAGGAGADALKKVRLASALAEAEAARTQENWEGVLRAANTALEAAPESERAKALRTEAERALTPRLTVHCRVGDEDVAGARVLLDGVLLEERTPLTLSLNRTQEHIVRVVLSPGAGGRRYAPFRTVFRADAAGSHELRAPLTERPLPPDVVPAPGTDSAWGTDVSGNRMEVRELQRLTAIGYALPVAVSSRWSGIPFRLIAPMDRAGGRPRLPADAPAKRPGEGQEGIAAVTATFPFYASVSEVTREQWWAVMGDGAAPGSGVEQVQLPVVEVTRGEAEEFCRRLCLLEGVPAGTYRLPALYEWRTLAQGLEGEQALPTDGPGDALARLAWYLGNSDGSRRPVGGRQANGWGLQDVLGNVWEWCGAADTAGQGAAGDGTALEEAFACGGAWSSPAEECHAGFVRREAPGTKSDDIGFRLIRILPGSLVIE